MRIIFVAISIWIFLGSVCAIPIYFPDDDDDVGDDGGQSRNFDGESDREVGDVEASKKFQNHYCLFHVDLRCKDSCVEMGFTNGKCYKGVCVCKGAERNAVRKLRLSGKMIVPYLMDTPQTTTADVISDDGDTSTPRLLTNRAKSNAVHAIVYDKAMLDDLVRVSHDEIQTTTTMKAATTTTTTHRPHTHMVASVDVGYHVLPEPVSVDEKQLPERTSLDVDDDRDDDNVRTEDIPSVYVLEEAKASDSTAAAAASSYETESTTKQPRMKADHHDHHKRKHHQHRHRHHNVDDEDIIFELGYPQNLKGKILGVAKEYDPQHLFSDEDTRTGSVLPFVIADDQTKDASNLVSKSAM